MIAELVKIDEKRMLRDWALAEIHSVVYRTNIEGHLPQQIRDKIKRSDDQFTEVEWRQLEEVIKAFRLPLLDGLLRLETKWYEGSLPEQELKDIEMINWLPFTKVKGSNKLIDLAQAFREGKMPLELSEFDENLRQMRDGFRLEYTKGRLIIVSQSSRPPYFLVEGYKRSCNMLLDIQEGEFRGGHVPLILGVCERLAEWDFA